MLKGSLPEVFLDTDVAFDIISKREPHFFDSIKLLELKAKDQIILFISESCVTNLIYLTLETKKIEDGLSKLTDFIASCEVINCGKQIILESLKSEFKDKEDAVQYFTALHHGADYFITRNTKDYKSSKKALPVFLPSRFLDGFSE
jgi:predicted nucleic acid-binding protein